MLFLLQQSIWSELTLNISDFLDCPAGFLGSGFCVPCPDGSYAEADDTVCTPCGENKNTGGVPGTSVASCGQYFFILTQNLRVNKTESEIEYFFVLTLRYLKYCTVQLF